MPEFFLITDLTYFGQLTPHKDMPWLIQKKPIPFFGIKGCSFFYPALTGSKTPTTETLGHSQKSRWGFNCP
jgi:hypothetical protein